MQKKSVTTLSLPKGFTLIEVLIVISILALLAMGVLFSVSKQRLKADDARAKSDLSNLKISFEDYYNDHNCYPDEAAPYILEKDSTGCKWFKIYTTLQDPNDPQAASLRTSDPVIGSTLGNYGVSSTNTTVSVFYGESTPTPTPIPSAPGDVYFYCISGGGCTTKPANLTCDPTWVNDSDCGRNCLPSTCTFN